MANLGKIKKVASLAGIDLSDDTVTLKANGSKFEGWKEISIKRSLKAISGAFTLSIVDKWAEEQVPWKIAPGDECEVQIGSDTAITGYVDEVSPTADVNDTGIEVTGRDKLADMVDCSAIHRPGNWQKISLKSLAEKLAAPFDIEVESEVFDFERFNGVRIQQGESAFECLERYARQRGVLLTTDGEGTLLISKPGSAGDADDALEQGVNVIRARATYSFKNRFSKYIVKGQADGLDDLVPALDFACQSTKEDSAVDRYRPLLIISEGAATRSICKKRAAWEKAHRLAQSTQVRVSVQGWRQSSGALWVPNLTTQFTSKRLGLNIELLISEVEYKKTSSGGATTEMLLEPAKSYDPDPTLEARKDPIGQLVIQERLRR